MKRLRTVVAKPGQLRAAWGRCERGDPPSIVYAAGGDGASKSDVSLLIYALEIQKLFDERKTLLGLLADRGYDLTTLKFSIQKKVEV
jgi:hypothetical protein